MKLLKIAFSAGGLGKTNGTEEAPDKVAEKLKDFFLSGIGTPAIFEPVDVNVDNSNMEQSMRLIENLVHQTGGKSVILGGDHSISYASVKGFAKKHQNFGLVVFDAHPDMMQDKILTHESWLFKLINEGIVKAENVVLVGVRNIFKTELDFLKNNNIKYFCMREISFDGKQEVCDAIMSVVRRWKSAYVSIDIDVLDPSFAPGTGHPEPGGMTTRELIYFLQRLKLLKNIVMADIVEVNPKKDINNLTVSAAAKLVVELC